MSSYCYTTSVSPHSPLSCSPIPEGTAHLSVSHLEHAPDLTAHAHTCVSPGACPVDPSEPAQFRQGMLLSCPRTAVTLHPHRPICRSRVPTRRDCALGPSSDVSKYSSAASRSVRFQPRLCQSRDLGPRPEHHSLRPVAALPSAHKAGPRTCWPQTSVSPPPGGPTLPRFAPQKRSLLTAEVGVPGNSTKQGLGFNAANL